MRGGKWEGLTHEVKGTWLLCLAVERPWSVVHGWAVFPSLCAQMDLEDGTPCGMCSTIHLLDLVNSSHACMDGIA